MALQCQPEATTDGGKLASGRVGGLSTATTLPLGGWIAPYLEWAQFSGDRYTEVWNEWERSE